MPPARTGPLWLDLSCLTRPAHRPIASDVRQRRQESGRGRPRQRPASDGPSETAAAAAPSLDRTKIAISVGLALAVLVAYGAGLSFGFADIDDGAYVFRNPHVAGGLSLANLGWALTHFHVSNWHPLTWVSLQLDATLFGLNPQGFHFTNLALHVVASVLLFLALDRMSADRACAAAVAFLFAVHPTRVESVVWITERKDVLSGVFWSASLLAYAAYVRKPDAGRYALVALLFVFGLMSKPMVLTLPFVLLLDAWPLGRLSLAGPVDWRSVGNRALEKVPLLAASILLSVVTFLAQSEGRAVRTMDALALPERLETALAAYARYVAMLLWPRGLIPFYPHAEIHRATLVAAVVAVGTLTVAALRGRRAHPYAFVGWFWYLGTLLPVIGLVQVGDQAMADRYTYIPSIGIFVALVWGLRDAARHFRLESRKLAIAGAALAIVLLALTRQQTGYWESPISLWKHALDASPGNHYAVVHLMAGYLEKGQIDAAIEVGEKGLTALRGSTQRMTERSDAAITVNLGLAYLARQRYADAKSALESGLKTLPDSMTAHFAYVNALLGLGQTAEATATMERVFTEYPAEPMEPWVKLSQQMARNGASSQALQVLDLVAGSFARKQRYREAAEAVAEARRLAETADPSRTAAYDALLKRYAGPASSD